MEKIVRKTHQIDATDRPLGRLASEIAILLRGKNKPSFRPHIDGGDIVEISNCNKIKFSGKKFEQKVYIHHTMHPGGLRTKKLADVFAKDPGMVLKEAVMGMLPKNKLRDLMIKRLLIKK